MSDTQLTREARALHFMATLAMVLLCLNLLRLVGIVPMGFALATATSAGDLSLAWPETQRFLRSLVEILPTLTWMGGVWSARGMFARIAEGELFSAANSRGLASIGAALMWGAGAAMVFVPWILSWIDGEYGFSGLRLDEGPLVLAVIGGAVLVVGRMMARAGRLQSELDEII